jgi:hypothetical protein
MTKGAGSDDAQREPDGVVLHPELEEVVVLQLGRLQQRLPQIRGQGRQGGRMPRLPRLRREPREVERRVLRRRIIDRQGEIRDTEGTQGDQVVRVGLRRQLRGRATANPRSARGGTPRPS